MKELFDYLTMKSHLVIILWFILAIITVKIYEIFLAKRINTIISFSDDRNKQVMFGVFLSALTMLALTLTIAFFYKTIFMWFVLSIGVALGSLFGILPSRNKSKKK